VDTTTVLLSGIVGSTAYGLAGPDSDVDRLGVFAVPTASLLGLVKPDESVVSTSPDRTLHELGKWLRLAMAGNPTVTELAWLPDELYEVRTPIGAEMIAMRESLLGAQRVRDAYLGYAAQQFRKLENRGDGSFSADTRRRTAKHARHLYRLCWQGFEAYTTGAVPVRLPDPQRFLDFGAAVAAGNLDTARDMLASYEAKFDAATTALPDEPDHERADAWLVDVRLHLLGRSGQRSTTG
jgi:predicted nucleotidyltransferase